MTSSNRIFALRKEKRSAEALELARAEFPNNKTDIWLLRAYAWVLYDHVNRLVDAHEAKQLSPAAFNSQLCPYFREFSRMGNPLRGDGTFSQMVRLGIKSSKDWQEFLLFARWVGFDDFTKEDKAPFVKDQGKTVDSLQKRFTRAVCRETVAKAADPNTDRDLVQWGQSVMEDALKEDPNDQWINYYQSKLHLAHGDADLAIKCLTPVLRRQPRAAWPWSQLGEVLEATRLEDALTCYSHATQLAREEQEVAKVRIHLADRLAHVGRFNEAAQQTSLALKYREQHGYNVPQELQQLLASDWYRKACESNGFQRLPDSEPAAKALLKGLDQRSLTYVQGVIDHINAAKGLSYVLTGTDAGIGLMHRKFPKVANLQPGTIVEIGREGPEGMPQDWRLSDARSIPGLCDTFSGTLVRQEEKDFALIHASKERIFVPPNLAKAFLHGKPIQVSCLAIRRTNKEGKTGWRATNVLGQDGSPIREADGNGPAPLSEPDKEFA